MKRRDILLYSGAGFVTLASGGGIQFASRQSFTRRYKNEPASRVESAGDKVITLFLCGDVMTGRGIDQILPHAGDPRLCEVSIKDARNYVRLAERVNGEIPKPAPFSYIWGAALEELDRVAPDARIVNLETSITASDECWPDKAVNYRMHPKNIPCLQAANIDCCVLANNHVLDWGYAGLTETLQTLRKADIKTSGAGANLSAAQRPAVLNITNKGRVLVYSYGSLTGGIPRAWTAGPSQAGVNLLPDFSAHTVEHIAGQIRQTKRRGDIVIASIHWGDNWGYEIPEEQTQFAHRLIDEAAVDVVHGHSSHHVKGVEIYEHKPILYGCGDFLTDYEGISGYEEFRGDLTMMYFISMDPNTGRLLQFNMTPLRMQRLRLHRASSAEARWLGDMLNKEGKTLGTRTLLNADNSLTAVVG